MKKQFGVFINHWVQCGSEFGGHIGLDILYTVCISSIRIYKDCFSFGLYSVEENNDDRNYCKMQD